MSTLYPYPFDPISYCVSTKLSAYYSVSTKTDKLIEAILKCQQGELSLSLSHDAEAIVTALGSGTFKEEEEERPAESTHKEEEEELLVDIEFSECDSQDSINSLKDRVGDSKSSLDDLGSGKHKAGTPTKTHKRSGTYDVEEEENEKRSGGKEGRKKQQTFDLTSSIEVTLSIDEKEIEENSRHLSLLTEKVTVRGSRRNGAPSTRGKAGDAQPASRTGSTPSSLQPASKDTMLSSPWQTRSSLSASAKRQRRSVTVTPSAPAPPLRSSRWSPFRTPALTKPTTTMDSTTTTNTTTTAVTSASAVTTTSSSSKPVFTLGCGDKKSGEEASQKNKRSGKGSSGIPRFLSYTRRLKVPNFARIHEQAFHRLDGLDDYVDKRRARQDTLGSTTKKQQPKPEVFQPSVTSIRNLNFNFAEDTPEDSSSGTADPKARSRSSPNRHCDKLPVPPSSSEPLDAVPRLPSSRCARRAIGGGAKLSRRVTRDATNPCKHLEASAKPGLTRKSPRMTHKHSPKRMGKISPKSAKKGSPKTGLKVTPKPCHKGSPQAGDEVCSTTAQNVQTARKSRASLRPVSNKKVSNMNFPEFGSHLKENCKPGKQSVSSPLVSKLLVSSEVSSPTFVRKRMQEYSRNIASRKVGYVPYKGAVKPLKDRNELKTLAERKHRVKSSKEIREGQKGILKGVRLNKRFELQMANRGLTL